jgi:electron transfer flavoprotein alpha subunit
MDATKYNGVWILAEQRDRRVGRISHELLSRARALADKRGTTLTAAILSGPMPQAQLEQLIARGADEVLAVQSDALDHFLVEPFSACLGWLIQDRRPEVLIAGATSTGRTLLPYLAARIHAGLTADCTELDIDAQTGNLLQTRPAIGGNILATIQTPEHRPQMATVRPRSTRPAPADPDRTGRIERIQPPDELLASRVRRIGFRRDEDDQPLAEAEKIVTVGRGIKKPENLPLARDLAARLGAALGATRDVVDRGWLGYPHQIGLSGKTVTPRLYVGIGASGSIQHLAGMQTSQTIVAINSDPEAQIFRVADFGIVGDLFQVVPALLELLEQRAETGPTEATP